MFRILYICKLAFRYYSRGYWFPTLLAPFGLFLLAVVIVEESVTLRELGPGICDVACEQQQISRLHFPSEPHEYQGIQGQG